MKKAGLFLLAAMILVSSSPVFASPAPDWTADSICTRVASMAYYAQSVTIDANGKEVEGALVKTHVFGYEASGYRTQYITYSPDGKQAQLYLYNYDDVGPDVLQLNSITQYDGPSKKVIGNEKMSYDKAKNTATSIKSDVSGNLLSTTIYYANANNLDYLVEVYDASGKLINKTETQYNSNNQVSSQTYTDFLTGEVTTTKMEYVPNSIRIAREVIERGNEVIVGIYEYEDYDDNWVLKNSYKSTDGTTDSKSLVLFERVYRLITPFG